MSFSLSSLLNPSPESETAPPTLQHKDSLPPIQYVQSPEHQFTTSPQSAHAPHHRPSFSSDHDAVQALAALSGSGSSGSSNAPPPLQSSWYGSGAAPPSNYPRRSDSYEQRPSSSGHNESVQLPPPSATSRNPSSPTLDQYHVAARSPEHRRQSIVSPTQSQSNFTLPPIQSLQPQPGYSPPQLNAYEPPQYRPTTADANNSSRHQTASSRQEPRRSSPSVHGRPASPPNGIRASGAAAKMEESSSPIPAIKQEASETPRDSSPLENRRASDAEPQSLKAIASLKNEHGLRTHSPLRESSVPVPSTESAVPEPAPSKKRPAPAKTKKGTATTKRGPPMKKRKIESKRSVSPSSRASKAVPFRAISNTGTPVESSPAPSTRSQSDGAYDDPSDEDEDMADGDEDGDVYCICRKPDTGTFMIGCDGTCDDWFHGKCVKIEERDKNLIDKYICPACTDAGVGKTTWKRMCRRSGCRQAARVGKTKGGKDGSKYCSEECGVLYFREMLARTRGREDSAKHRNSRRKTNNPTYDQPSIDYDLGARGGTLAAGELKSLINSSTTSTDFKKLGEGVLSPPATPDSKSPKENSLNDTESQALQTIHDQKEASRRKHQLLKDRMKFVTMAKQAASRTATEKELKPKDYCGYDSRLEWTDAQFARWRAGPTGQQAFELDTLATDRVDDPDTINVELTFEVCDRKKCARHLEWTKLAVDDVRFAMSENSDRMRALEKEELDLKERAALRAKAGSLNGEGRAEVHGLGIDVDAGGDAVKETVEGTKGEVVTA